MFYLAKVKKKEFAGKTMLQLLAQQKSDHFWGISPDDDSILPVDVEDYGEGNLVLVELSDSREVLAIQDATDWILELVESYLASGITPDLLHHEAERVEQWRQSLTLQSQEVARRALEIEARRDQIQELEKNLKQERKQLELNAMEIEARYAEMQEIDRKLQQERQRLELIETRLKAGLKANGSPT